MAKMRDLEELLSTIIDPAIRDYMAEAMVCYSVSAYRATIVMSFIALFDDLFNKIDTMGAINKKARDIHREIKKKIDNQEVFEKELLDRLKCENLLPSLDAKFADILRELRNKSAHPSGHTPSAEEARYVFSETISRFLSREFMSARTIIDEVIYGINRKNLFPNNSIQNIAKIVDSFVSKLPPDISGLKMLLAKVWKETQNDDKVISKNAKFFISGLVHNEEQKDVLEEVSKQILEKATQDEQYYGFAQELISICPSLIDYSEDVTVERTKVALMNRVTKGTLHQDKNSFQYPFITLNSFRQKKSLNSFNEIFPMFLEKALLKFQIIEEFFKDISEEDILVLFEKLTAHLKRSKFEILKEAINRVNEIHSFYEEDIENNQSIVVLSLIYRASEMNEYTAKSIVDSNFSSLEKFKSIASDYLQENSPICEELFSEHCNKGIFEDFKEKVCS